MSHELIAAITIPLFTGAIGWVTNWSGIWMLFNPLRFVGFTLPGLRFLANLLPRRLQEIPGIMQGGIGWQGIIPSRAAKMGSIAVDKGIAKIGGPSDFYAQLEPDQIAAHILETSQRDIRGLVERVMLREHPQLWRSLPAGVKEAVHGRVQAQLPQIVHRVTDGIGANIDQLLDVKLMVIRHIEANPELACRIFQDTGQKELKFIITFGFFFGFACGIPLVGILELLPHWWAVPIGGVVIGYLTNLIAIRMIFSPVEPTRYGPVKFQGLFLQRQDEVAGVYAKIIAENVVTIGNIGEQLLHGPRSDRTRRMIEDALRPAVDEAIGPARAAVRVAVGRREYDAIREGVAIEGVDYTMTPLKDPDFNARQAVKVHQLIQERMRKLPAQDFSEMLRSALEQDEWLLVLHGAVLGFFAGLLHYGIFGV